LTRIEAIREACRIIALAYHSIGDYSKASDGFCDKCSNHQTEHWHYSNQGAALKYVRTAVSEKLKRDGYEIASGFDKKTGQCVVEE
jgi:hypothetical protein